MANNFPLTVNLASLINIYIYTYVNNIIIYRLGITETGTIFIIHIIGIVEDQCFVIYNMQVSFVSSLR